jgi:hypothetical protein
VPLEQLSLIVTVCDSKATDRRHKRVVRHPLGFIGVSVIVGFDHGFFVESLDIFDANFNSKK